MIGGIALALVALAFAIVQARRAPRALAIPLMVFTATYVITSALGATALASPDIRELWALMFPGMDQRWLDFGNTFGYWFMVWGPLFITTLAAVYSYRFMRRPALACAKVFRARVDVLPAAIVGLTMVAYCVTNLAQTGFLGGGFFSGETAGQYAVNIRLRAEMFAVLGALHFACIYTGIPAIALVALHQAVRRRSPAWAILFAVLSLALCFLYVSTLTKSNILIYGIEVTIAAQVLGLMRIRGALVAAAVGTLVLTGLSALLSGSGPLDLAFTGYNILFRESSNIPFYLAVFPDQIPFVGLDLGLGGFGFGPTIPTNEMVSNFMWPKSTIVQGAAPAAAHVMAYAEGGYWWAAITMALVGVWIGFVGGLRRVLRNPVTFSGFIGAIAVCYYTSQANLVGAFNVTYGYRWWLASLLVLMGLQRVMRFALQPDTKGTTWTKPPRVIE